MSFRKQSIPASTKTHWILNPFGRSLTNQLSCHPYVLDRSWKCCTRRSKWPSFSPVKDVLVLRWKQVLVVVYVWSSQWVVEHWNCGVTMTVTLVQVCKLLEKTNLWRICVGSKTAWKIYQDFQGLIVPCLVWINFWHLKEPWGSLTVLIHFHLNEPVMVNRRKTPGWQVVFMDGSTSIKPIKSKMWSANFIMTHIPRPFIKHAKFSGATRYA